MKKRLFILFMTFMFLNVFHIAIAELLTGNEHKPQENLPINKITFTNNLHVPISVFIYSYDGNERTIKELYAIIDSINTSESLKKNDDYNKEISLIVLMDQTVDNSEAIEVINSIIKNKNARKGKKRSVSGQSGSTISMVYTTSEETIWLQDLLEFGSVYHPEKKWVPAVFDLKYGGKDTSSDIIKDLSKKYNLQLLDLKGTGADESMAGDSGGNIETTPDGIVYVGSSMTAELKTDLAAKTGQNILVLPTDWLHVGHVDEYFFFMPADNSCGFSTVYADPVEALNRIIRDKNWRYPPRSAVAESMRYFLKKKTRKKYYTFADFDLSKSIRKKGNIIEVIYGKYTDWFVLQNLKAYAQIQNGIKIIKNSLSCNTPFIPVPVIFQEAHDEQYFMSTGLVMKNPLTNALILRDHVIIPNGHFSSVAVKRLKSRYKNNVHVIHTDSYEKNFGSIHCATNVLRDSRYVVKVIKKNKQVPKKKYIYRGRKQRPIS